MEPVMWIARPYRYADGLDHNENRYEVFYRVGPGSWLSVGGAICSYQGGVIAFLCHHREQRRIRRPLDAEVSSEGTFVWADTLRDALEALKRRWPEPVQVLQDRESLAMANF